MAKKLMWGILGGAGLGAAFGYVGGNTGICIAAGAVAAGIWHYMERGKLTAPLVGLRRARSSRERCRT